MRLQARSAIRLLAVLSILALPWLAAQPASAQGQAAEAARVDAALSEAGRTLDGLERGYADLPWTKDRIDDFIALARQVDTLRAEMLALDAAIARLEAGGVDPVARSLVLARDDYGGPALTGPVTGQTILAAEAVIAFPQAGAVAPITDVLWQIHDASGAPIPGAGKAEQVALAGQDQAFRFRFRPSALGNGSFTLRLALRRTDTGAVIEAGALPFQVLDAVRISRVVIAGDQAAAAHRDSLDPSETAFFFVYYTLEGASAATVRFIVDSGEGTPILLDQTAERPLKPALAEQRAGVRLAPEALPPDGALRFRAFVSANGSQPVGAETTTQRGAPAVSGELIIDLIANNPRDGDFVPFSLYLPDGLTPPLSVDLHPFNAEAFMDSADDGIIVPSVPPGLPDAFISLEVTVTDARGRSVFAAVNFRALAGEQMLSTPEPLPPGGGWVGALDGGGTVAAAPPPPPPPPDTSTQDAALAILEQLAAIAQQNLAAQNQANQGGYSGGGYSAPAPQSAQEPRIYYALITHSVIPGVCLSSQTAVTCEVLQGGPNETLSCGSDTCGATQFLGPGAEQCSPGRAWTSVRRLVGAMTLTQAQNECGRVAASAGGYSGRASSCSFWCQ